MPLILAMAILLSGCAGIGGISRTRTTAQDSVRASVSERIEQREPAPVVGSISVTATGNAVVSLPVPVAQRASYTATRGVDSRGTSGYSEEEESRSGWYYILLAASALIGLAVLEYARRVWFGGIRFASSQAGGIRLGTSWLREVGEEMGAATDPAALDHLRALRGRLIAKLHSLETKKRDDR